MDHQRWIDKFKDLIMDRMIKDMGFQFTYLANGNREIPYIIDWSKHNHKVYKHFIDGEYGYDNNFYRIGSITAEGQGHEKGEAVYIYILQDIRKDFLRKMILSIDLNEYMVWYLKFDEFINDYYKKAELTRGFTYITITNEIDGRYGELLGETNDDKHKNMDQLTSVYLMIYILSTKKIIGYNHRSINIRLF